MSIVRATGPTGLLGKFLRLFRPVHGETSDEFASHADRPNNSLQFIKAHLHHAVADIVVNLLGVAVVINSLYVLSCSPSPVDVVHVACLRILILAATVFHQPGVDDTSADIFDAHSLLSDIVGRGEMFCSSQATVT
jgi:metal iron transporter